ncbi:MAG: hypothetical protein K1000chlam4_00131 [Chlamydiae bacterium]|nr:hypothetical protein [Chlamydiota bacterium]
MHSELVHLGETIKKRRQERGLSIKEVENATSIRSNFLEAIEEGHLAKLISPVYAQGFLKKYAAFLELDGETLIKDHPSVMKILSETPEEKAEFSYGLSSIEVRGSPGSEVKWLSNFLWVGVSVVVILSAWFLARYFGLI